MGTKTMLTVRQAAEALGVTLRHVLTLLYEAKLPGSYKLGLQWQIPEEAVKARAQQRKAAHPRIGSRRGARNG